MFAQLEHTVLRLDFVSDKARVKEDDEIVASMEGLFGPSCMYLTQRWIHGLPDEASWNAMRGEQWFSCVSKKYPGMEQLVYH